MGRTVSKQKKVGVIVIDNTNNRWSYSRITAFENCKYAFYLNYVINDDEQYLSEGNYYAELGSYVHSILQMIFDGKLSVDDALSYYLDNYDNNICYKVSPQTMRKNYEIIADYFAGLTLDWLRNYEVLGVELETKFHIAKYNFIGYIDLLLRDKRDGKIVVVDHKSTEYPFKQDGTVKKKCQHSFESYKRQMYLYCHAVKKIYGEFPKEMVWNHFKDDKFATIQFVQSEYEDVTNWTKNTLNTIEQEKDFEPTMDYFYCHNLCNFRNSCEYQMM